MDIKSEFFALIGEVATVFSNLSFAVAEIAATLADPSPGSPVGHLVADDRSLARCLQTVQKLSRFRFVHSQDTVTRIAKFCKDVDAVREVRNLFVHGMWNLDPASLSQGKATVFDPQWKEVKNASVTTEWARKGDKTFTIDELKGVRDSLGPLVQKGLRLSADLRSLPMMPGQAKKGIAEPAVNLQENHDG